jgi:hypothetical protein
LTDDSQLFFQITLYIFLLVLIIENFLSNIKKIQKKNIKNIKIQVTKFINNKKIILYNICIKSILVDTGNFVQIFNALYLKTKKTFTRKKNLYLTSIHPHQLAIFF